jgi:hypothetical protein
MVGLVPPVLVSRVVHSGTPECTTFCPPYRGEEARHGEAQGGSRPQIVGRGAAGIEPLAPLLATAHKPTPTTNYRTSPQMADDPAEPALSDSGGTEKVLVPQRDGELSTAVKAAQDFVAASRSKATLRSYKSDWHDFEKWCDRHCLITLPAGLQGPCRQENPVAKPTVGRLRTMWTVSAGAKIPHWKRPNGSVAPA